MKYSNFKYPSPLGILNIYFTKRGIYRITFIDKGNYNNSMNIDNQRNIRDCDYLIYKYIYLELNNYFTGRITRFEVPVVLEGTDFQKRVWKELMTIPYGEYVSYGEIATRIGSPGAARAVGKANNKNKILIVVPCHRVIGSDGKLTGYAGGIERKKWLICHENKYRRGVYCGQRITSEK
ncbi:MAG: methylated-DNA--[protein]-cysteine S-methyltransferase [Halanaerobiaceae bacterium]